MTTQRAIEILETYKMWSSGEGRFSNYKERFPYTKLELNEAVLFAIGKLRNG